MNFSIFAHFNSLFVHTKHASNMAAWYNAQFSDFTAPRVYMLTEI